MSDVDIIRTTDKSDEEFNIKGSIRGMIGDKISRYAGRLD